MLRLIKRLRFLKNKPILIPIILKNYLKLLLLGKPVLRSIELHTTSSCQCKCIKCSALNLYNHKRTPLTIDQISKLTNECYKLGAVNVGITGGEPLEDKRLFSIIKNIKPQQALINVSTTGLLLTKETALKLKKLGVDTVFISIDSPTPEEHDKERGVKGCFDKAVEAIENAKKAGLIITINTVFTHRLISSRKYIELNNLVKKHNASWNLIYPCITGGLIKSQQDLDENDDLIIKQLERENIWTRNDKSDNYVKYGCPAGVEKIFITVYGDVMPCACIPISFGNVLNEPIEMIWGKMQKIPEFNDRSKVCNASLNKDFIKKFLEPLKGFKQFPVPIEKHPAFNQNKS